MIKKTRSASILYCSDIFSIEKQNRYGSRGITKILIIYLKCVNPFDLKKREGFVHVHMIWPLKFQKILNE